IPGVELLEPAEQAICCGSAGIYNLTQPEAARELGERKAANVAATGAEVYAAGQAGCLLQVSKYLRHTGRPLPALHPVELLDASLRGVGDAQLLASGRRWRLSWTLLLLPSEPGREGIDPLRDLVANRADILDCQPVWVRQA